MAVLIGYYQPHRGYSGQLPLAALIVRCIGKLIGRRSKIFPFFGYTHDINRSTGNLLVKPDTGLQFSWPACRGYKTRYRAGKSRAGAGL